MDDKMIIELFFERSEKAITELSDKYGLLCKYIANNILNCDSDAEECVNDTYLAVWDTIPPNTPAPLKAYICRIARNIALKKYHSNTAQKRNTQYDVSLSELEGCFSDSDEIDGNINAKETAKIISQFLEEQPVQVRVMFIKRYFYCESLENIAKHFKTSKHYVSVKLSRTRDKLKKHLSERGVEI